MATRIHKLIAKNSQYSLRQAEQLIRTQAVYVNGKQASIGQLVTHHDTIIVNKVVLKPAGFNTRVIAYHKPVGEFCSRTDTPSIFSSLPNINDGHWQYIGRLDVNTSGLLLCTNDGMLLHQLTKRANKIDREYAVRVYGNITDTMLAALRTGIELEDGVARFTDIAVGKGENMNHWFHVVLQSGGHRQVRRLWQAVDAQVSRLIRVRFGTIMLLPSVKPKQFFELSQDDINSLKALVRNA